MSKSAVQLKGSSSDSNGRFRSIFCEAEAFLLGPGGEVWDLDPQLDSAPSLLSYVLDGVVPVHAPSGELTNRMQFQINHRSRYLQLQAVSEELRPGIAHLELQDGCFDLCPFRGQAILVDAERTREALVLRAQRWSGAVSTPYLLITPRSSDSDYLLDFARSQKLPRHEPDPWLLPLTSGWRGRLSSLAESTPWPLRRSLIAAL